MAEPVTFGPAQRIQAYLSNPAVRAALEREARRTGLPLSQAAARAIARGLARSPAADPEDRLLRLDRALRDHMRSTARDMEILQELVAGLARVLFLALPDSAPEPAPLARAAAERRLERMLDEVAARLASAPARAARRQTLAQEAAPATGPEPRSFEARP